MLGVQESIPVEEEGDFPAEIDQMLPELARRRVFLEDQVALDLHFEDAFLLLDVEVHQGDCSEESTYLGTVHAS